jgi:hypothetical protein
MKTKDGKEIQVEFAPGAFDTFEGTQEELDAFQKEIMDTIANMTPEELAEESIVIDEEYLEQLMDEDPEYARRLIQALTDDPNNPTRTLQ